MHNSRNRAWWGVLILLSFGHLVGDFYAVLLNSLLHEFKQAFDLSKLGVAVLVNVASFSNSMLQPLAGHLSERINQKLVFAAGLAIAAGFLSCIGLAPGPVWLGVLIALGGIGVAMFHPTGAVLASEFAGPRRGLGMSIYTNGGAAGLALAPVAVALLLRHGTRQQSWILMPFGLAAAVLMCLSVPRPTRSAPSSGSPTLWSLFGQGPRSVWFLFASHALRSLVVVAVSSFIVIYGTEIGWTRDQGLYLLAAFMLACTLGGIVGGYVSDYTERRRLMLAACFVGFWPFAAIWYVPYAAAFPLLVIAGGILSISTPINIVAAQQLRPDRASAISGVMMGLAWSAAVLLLIPLGWLADMTSTATALRVSSFVLPLAGLCVLPLPKFPPLLQHGA